MSAGPGAGVLAVARLAMMVAIMMMQMITLTLGSENALCSSKSQRYG